MLSTLYTTITAVPIQEIVYTVTDPKQGLQFDSFIISDPSIGLNYYLVMASNGNPYDPDVFDFDSNNRIIYIKEL